MNLISLDSQLSVTMEEFDQDSESDADLRTIINSRPPRDPGNVAVTMDSEPTYSSFSSNATLPSQTDQKKNLHLPKIKNVNKKSASGTRNAPGFKSSASKVL